MVAQSPRYTRSIPPPRDHRSRPSTAKICHFFLARRQSSRYGGKSHYNHRDQDWQKDDVCFLGSLTYTERQSIMNSTRRRLFTRLSLLISFFTLTAAQSNAEVLSGPVTNPINGNSYYLLSTASWTTSQAEAVQLGGNLVTINDALEDAWVFDTFATPSRMLWIGLNDLDAEGQFEWVGGEVLAYTHWSAGEPQGGQLENWVAIRTQALGPEKEWIDWQDNGDFFGVPVHGVVEVVVPEPSTQFLACVLIVASTIKIRNVRTRSFSLWCDCGRTTALCAFSS